ncbi:MAG: YggS family pyridoxal phosphate-dependent enzyme [Actinomycetaceae bacterium]|nr:YggS family pyridoxal phosphate-dependent enzyme [Actinomycetaceae bacterium]
MSDSHAPITAADIRANIEKVYERIHAAATQAGRTPTEIALELAVKTQTLDTCVEAAKALANLGHPILLGHNKVQEGVAAAEPVLSEVPSTRMHMIGHVQTNKINQTLRSCHVIETVDSSRFADRLNQRVRSDDVLRPDGICDVFIQVNSSGEQTKFGCSPAEAYDLACHVAALPNLRLRGFMTIGAHTDNETAVHRSFSKVRALRDRCISSGEKGLSEAVELSMGMTGDMEIAIAEGSTIVRVGTAVFGPRR